MNPKNNICFARQQLLAAGMLAILFAVLPGPARADSIGSSLNNSPVSTIGFGNGSWAASSFRTDNQFWNLSAVTVMLGGGSSSIADLRLYSDAGGQPGVSLVDLGPLTLSGGSGLLPVTFTLAGGFTLAPETTYWVALGNTSLSQSLNVGMLMEDVPPPFGFTGAPGVTMTCSVASSILNGVNPPTTWTAPGVNGALLFAVEGTPVVPEPTTFSIALVAIMGCAIRSRSLRFKSRN